MANTDETQAILIRIPKVLHQALRMMALKNSTTMNALARNALEQYVMEKGVPRREHKDA